MTPTKTARFNAVKMTSDVALGTCGCALAVASASFGLYMTFRSPSPSLGTGGEFSVFAQLAPRTNGTVTTHGPSTRSADLDTEATASIPRAPHPDVSDPADDAPDSAPTGRVVSGITLQKAGADVAEIEIGGKMRTVKVGDSIPGAGEVLAIYPGRRPMLKTSLGVIMSAAR